MSVPSVVFAEEDGGAIWYGSLRVGVTSSATAGIADGGSRWGVKGSSEVSEGLTANYHFESKIDGTSATIPGGRISSVGLSGGFGSLTLGHIWAASYNSVGAITDNSNYLGDSEVALRHGSVVSYAVSVENISIQADAVMNNGWGTRSTAATPAIAQHGDAPNHSLAAGKAKAEDKNVDEFHLGFSMGLGESGKIAFAHISHDTAADVKKKSNLIAGQYTIGSMTAYLGVAQHKTDDNTAGPDADGRTGLGGVDATTNLKQLRSQKDSTTFAGIRGSVGDTGLTYLFQARSKKTKGSSDVYTDNANTDSTSKLDTNKYTPWMMGLYRSLGGGATVMFEHGNPDQTGMKSTSHLALKIDF